MKLQKRTWEQLSKINIKAANTEFLGDAKSFQKPFFPIIWD